MKKQIFIVSSAFALLFASSVSVFAHAVVNPLVANVAQFETFTLGVPNEKDNPTVLVRLVLPQGLTEVVPNVKQGWKISEKKAGSGDDAVVSEITWGGGNIPVGQRDDFSFSAQVPSNSATLVWKAYQTYQDGVVVSWDKEGADASAESDTSGPASHTEVINDLATPVPTPFEAPAPIGGIGSLISIVALVVSLGVAVKVLFKK